MIRQFSIYLNFLNICPLAAPFARSAANRQLRVLRGLKHGTRNSCTGSQSTRQSTTSWPYWPTRYK